MNILIVDELGDFGSFAKSILLSEKHRVSLSRTLEDAHLKIDTALFDVVICTPSETTPGLLQYITLECPYLPAVLVGPHRPEKPAGDYGSMVVRSIERPIQIAPFSRTMRELELMYRNQLTMMNRKLDTVIDVHSGPDRIPCRTAGVSMKGVLLVNPDRTSPGFHDFFQNHRQDMIETTLPLNESRTLAVHGHIGFTEASSDAVVQKVGLAIEFEETTEKKSLMEWIGI